MFGEIASTDYEGEIKKYGDKVHIRIIPNITINTYIIGQGLTYERPATADVELDIDQGRSYSFVSNLVELKQSDLAYVEKWTDDAAQQMAINIDTAILAGIYGSADTSNAGATAGAISSGFDMGTAASPEDVDKTNMLDYLVDMGTVLDEQNTPVTGRWVVLPAIFCGMIKKGDLKDASLAGDAQSIIRNGRLGMIDRFTVYNSNNVHSTAGVFDVVFGHPQGTTFASQLVENEVISNPNDFGKLHRGLQVYGYLVNNDDALGHFVGQKA